MTCKSMEQNSQTCKSMEQNRRPTRYRHLILTDMSKIHSREKIASSKIGTRKTGCQHAE